MNTETLPKDRPAGLRRLDHWIDGAPRAPGSGRYLQTVSPMTGQPALDVDLAPLKADAIVYDIVYAPLETDLLKVAKQRGHRTVDGLGMLLHQAVPGFERWFGRKPEVTPELRQLLIDDIESNSH